MTANTVLVGVDGSELSLKAIDQACAIANTMKWQVRLVYVAAPILLSPTTYGNAISILEKAQAETGEETLTVAKARAQRHGIAAFSVFLRGDAGTTLATAADSADVVLSVVGHRGNNALVRALIGSVAQRLLHTSTKPVLVVR